MTEKPRIGFIGVGMMGHGMAANLLAKGHPLVVLANRNRAPIDDLVARGAREASTPADLARAVDIVQLCLPGSPEVEAAIHGPNGVAGGARSGLIIIDSSTSDPVSTRRLAAGLASSGIVLVDAPLSRTPKEAAEGRLDTMVGADPDTFARIRPVLECWAKVIVHMGPVGTGHTMKLVNNFIAMGYANLYAEAMAIARRNGLTAAQFDSVIGAGRMRNGFYDTFMRWTLTGDASAHRFSIRNAHKDMRYLASMVTESGCVAPIAAVLRDRFAAMEASGLAERMLPRLADFVAAENGLPSRDNPEGS